ncbi:MAG: hypothetical protein ACI8RD_006491 [Bacillariaceae sp.]|jgi:hypothetical protein
MHSITLNYDVLLDKLFEQQTYLGGNIKYNFHLLPVPDFSRVPFDGVRKNTLEKINQLPSCSYHSFTENY